MDFILNHPNLGCIILLKLSLNKLLRLGLVSRKFYKIRIDHRFDSVWHDKLYERWLFRCQGKFVLKQYLSQFENVVVKTPKNKFWKKRKFVMTKMDWECYRDFVLLGNCKFNCEPIVKKSRYRSLMQNEEIPQARGEQGTTIVDYLETYLPYQLSPDKSKCDFPNFSCHDEGGDLTFDFPNFFFCHDKGGDLTFALKWWKKQYQITRTIQSYIPKCDLIARNSMKDGLAGPILRRKYNDSLWVEIGIEDKSQMTIDNPFFEVKIWRIPPKNYYGEQEWIFNSGIVHTIEQLQQVCEFLEQGQLEKAFRIIHRYTYDKNRVPDKILDEYVKTAMTEPTGSHDLEWKCRSDAEKEEGRKRCQRMMFELDNAPCQWGYGDDVECPYCKGKDTNCKGENKN